MLSLVLSYVYALGGVSEQLYLFDESTGQVVDSVFIGNLGDVPNFVYLPDRSLTGSGEVGIVINSGGFYGYPSLVYFEPVSNTIISEYSLPDSLNPMEGAMVGDTFYFTNYGKDGQGAAVYLFNGGTIVDSIEVGIKPIGIRYCFDYLFVATKSGYLYRINPADRSKDSLYLDPTISNVGCDTQYVYVLATGNYGNDDALIYRVDGPAFDFAGQSDTIRNSYVLAVGEQNIYAATFDGTLYMINRAEGSADSLVLGYSGILGLDFYDGNLYISAGAWMSDTNRILVYNESSASLDSYIVSTSDVGLGFLYAFSLQTSEVEKDFDPPFVYRSGVIYLKDEGRVSIYDARGRRLYSGITSSIDLRRFASGLLLIRIDGRTYRIVNIR